MLKKQHNDFKALRAEKKDETKSVLRMHWHEAVRELLLLPLSSDDPTVAASVQKACGMISGFACQWHKLFVHLRKAHGIRVIRCPRHLLKLLATSSTASPKTNTAEDLQKVTGLRSSWAADVVTLDDIVAFVEALVQKEVLSGYEEDERNSSDSDSDNCCDLQRYNGDSDIDIGYLGVGDWDECSEFSEDGMPEWTSANPWTMETVLRAAADRGSHSAAASLHTSSRRANTKQARKSSNHHAPLASSSGSRATAITRVRRTGNTPPPQSSMSWAAFEKSFDEPSVSGPDRQRAQHRSSHRSNPYPDQRRSAKPLSSLPPPTSARRVPTVEPQLASGEPEPQVQHLPAHHLPAQHLHVQHLPAQHLHTQDSHAQHLQSQHLHAQHLQSQHLHAQYLHAQHLQSQRQHAPSELQDHSPFQSPATLHAPPTGPTHLLNSRPFHSPTANQLHHPTPEHVR